MARFGRLKARMAFHKFIIAILFFAVGSLKAAEVVEVDICVYGGTSGGIAAGIQAARMGKRAVLLEFDGHIGGLTTGGLGATDIGNKAAIGGIAREFYGRIAGHYAREDAWIFEKPAEYFARRGGSQTQATDPGTMWTFEPHVAEQVFKQMLHQVG